MQLHQNSFNLTDHSLHSEPEDEDVAGGDDLDDLEDDGDEDEDDEDIDGSGNTAGTPSTSSPVKAESEDGLVTGSSDADPSTVGGSESGQGRSGHLHNFHLFFTTVPYLKV